MQQGQGNAARTALSERTFKNRISRQIAVRKLQSLALLLRLQGRQCGMAFNAWHGQVHGMAVAHHIHSRDFFHQDSMRQ